MAGFLIKLIINSLALWLTTLIVPGVTVVPYDTGTWPLIVSYASIALIFGLVNTFIGTFIRIVAFPLYVLTLGLISLLVNGLLLLLVAWLSTPFTFGLVIDGFWTGVLGALVLSIIGWVLGLLFRPVGVRPGI
jgi:putative membrane protein